MLDEDGANKILKKFNESIPGKRKTSATLEEKRRHILNIFQSRTPKMMRARQRNSPDPFYFYLNSLPTDILGDKDFNKSSIFLREARKKLPDYVRFGILLVKFPDEVRSNLDKIHENILTGKDPLDIYKFDNEGEFREYINISRELSIKEQVHDFANTLIKYLSENEKKELKHLCTKLETYSFMDYFNNFWDMQEKYSPFLLNLAFIQTHAEEEEKIQLLLLFEATTLMFRRADISKVESIKEDLSQQLYLKEEQINKLENKLQEQMNKVAVAHKENKNYKTREVDLKKRIVKLEKKERQLVELEQHNQELQSVLNNKKEEYEKRFENREVQLEALYKEKFKVLENGYKDYTLLYETLKEKNKHQHKSFAIICPEEFKLIKELFPKNAIVLKHEDQYLQELLKNEETKYFYIIDHNISNTEALNYISSIIGKKKRYKLTKISNIEKLMDFIGYLNYKERGL